MRLQFFVFPIHQLHVPTRIAEEEFAGVAVMRPLPSLAAWVGGLGRLVCGIPATHMT